MNQSNTPYAITRQNGGVSTICDSGWVRSPQASRIVDGKEERDNRDKWHLIKTDRNTRVVSKKRDDESALTKRTMMEIAAAADAVWQSNRR